MKSLCLILLFHASLQLNCDKGKITAHIGGEFVLICTYDTKHFLFSKKYWCLGDSRSTCEIVVDSENTARTKNSHRSHIVDTGRRGLFVKITNLRFDDSGVYWVGIERPYTDVMTSVKVVITEVPVSKPRLWPLSSLADRPTCWGQPATVRCGCTRGTAVRYTWFQNAQGEDILLHHSSDLHLHCGTVGEGGEYYCIAVNDVSSQRSDVLSVQVLTTADSSCIYVINMQGQSMYDCADRMSTTTATTPPPTTCQAPTITYPNTGNQFLQINQTSGDLFFSRAWTGEPFWYLLLRWGSFAFLLIFLCIAIKCTKARKKRVKRKRRACCRQMHHVAK